MVSREQRLAEAQQLRLNPGARRGSRDMAQALHAPAGTLWP
jgi:hypothetical protein